MPYCRNCGKQVADGAPYCLSCGAAQPVGPAASSAPGAPAGLGSGQTGAGQQAAPAAGAAPAAPSRHGGVPGWVIAIIVAGVVAIVVGPLIFIAASLYVVGDVVEDVVPVIDEQLTRSREATVREGVHSIQVGIQSWAVDHDDRYPPRRRVTSAGLARYVDEWPSNAFAEGPMQQGTGPGEFTYLRGPGGGSFTLTGYGESGTRLITVP